MEQKWSTVVISTQAESRGEKQETDSGHNVNKNVIVVWQYNFRKKMLLLHHVTTRFLIPTIKCWSQNKIHRGLITGVQISVTPELSTESFILQ